MISDFNVFNVHSCSVQKVWAPVFINKRPIWLYPLYIFFPNTRTFGNILQTIMPPMKCLINTKLNSWEKVVSSCLEDWKTIWYFLQATLLYNRQLEIWFEIITIVIKIIRNNQDLLSKKYYCCNIHTSLRESSSPPSIGNSPNMSYTPHLYKKILIPTFCDFSKISSLNR